MVLAKTIILSDFLIDPLHLHQNRAFGVPNSRKTNFTGHADSDNSKIKGNYL